MSAHEQFADDLALHALGSLEGEERITLEKHLEGCASCRRELESLRGDLSLLSLTTAGPKPPARSRQRLMAAVAAEPRFPKPVAAPAPRSRSWWGVLGWSAAAAMALLCIGLLRHNSSLSSEIAGLHSQIVGQQAQLQRIQHSDRHLTWIHIAFLFPVSILPFATTLLTEFMGYRTALLLYWADILLGGVTLYAAWSYGVRHGLVKKTVSADEDRAIRRRIVVAQLLYAGGAVLCIWSPWASIVIFIGLQIHFAIGPRSGWLSKV